MSLQSKEFRDGVAVVAIDPSAPYASGIRRALPQARIVLDHFHLVMLGNKMLTDVRQRVQHEQQGRRGMKIDPAWAHRRLLLRAGNELGPRTNTVQLGCHCGVAGLLLGLRPVVVVGAFDVPLGHLALDDPWR
jgi:transposase